MCERKSARRPWAKGWPAAYYRAKGCRVLEMNFPTRRGEIDDHCTKKGDMLIFAEVKTRDEGCRRAARRGCNSAKAAADRFGGTGYLLLHPELAENFMRFDVVEVTVPAWGRRG